MPGTFIFGIAGIVCMGVALVLTFDVSSLPGFFPDLKEGESPAIEIILYIAGCAIVAALFPILASKYLIPLLPEGWTPMLKTDLAQAVSPTEDIIQVKENDIGTAETLLRPVGHARFNDKLFDVQTKGEMIESGAKVRITEIIDGRIWVAAHKES